MSIAKLTPSQAMKAKELYLFYLTSPPKLHFFIRNYSFMTFLENSLKISVKNDTFIRNLDDIILGEEDKKEEAISYSQIKQQYGKTLNKKKHKEGREDI